MELGELLLDVCDVSLELVLRLFHLVKDEFMLVAFGGRHALEQHLVRLQQQRQRGLLRRQLGRQRGATSGAQRLHKTNKGE